MPEMSLFLQPLDSEMCSESIFCWQVLDEATSNVDNETDEIVQATVRRAFKECTVLTIAHRLHTIIDADRILLLEAGQVKELGSPQTLLTVRFESWSCTRPTAQRMV